MVTDRELRNREKARREALWTLARMQPGDPAAQGVLDVLDDIEREEQLDTVIGPALSVEEVRSLVPTEPHPIGYRIVRESDIPQPWRERFTQASTGSTRVPEGAYEHDWLSFLVLWQREIKHLDKHRAARKG